MAATSRSKKSSEDLLKVTTSDPRIKRLVKFLLSVDELSEQLEYPINSFNDLLTRMGDKSMVIGNFSFNVKNNEDNLREVIPAYYFPIVSKENFVEKANDLRNFYYQPIHIRRRRRLFAFRNLASDE